jgi:hypothetical protein
VRTLAVAGMQCGRFASDLTTLVCCLSWPILARCMPTGTHIELLP